MTAILAGSRTVSALWHDQLRNRVTELTVSHDGTSYVAVLSEYPVTLTHGYEQRAEPGRSATIDTRRGTWRRDRFLRYAQDMVARAEQGEFDLPEPEGASL